MTPSITLLEDFKAKITWTSDRIFQEAYHHMCEGPVDWDDDEEARCDPSSQSATDTAVGKSEHAELAELSKAIHQAARKSPVYVQSALHLVRECRILVRCYSDWVIKRTHEKDLETLEGLQEEVAHELLVLVAHEVLTRDLNRVLELLQNFSGKDLEYFKDPELFPGLFQYVFEYLVLPRPFVIHSHEVQTSAREGLGRGIVYDQGELLIPPQVEHLTAPLPSPLHWGPRRLVLCMDGICGDLAKNSSVSQMYTTLQKTDAQLTVYMSGIDTYLDNTFLSRTPTKLDLLMDQSFATFRNLKDPIVRGYKWIADRYREGDEIFLFGFSHGAHLVRCIAGMINKIGLIRRASKTSDEYPMPQLKPEELTGEVRDVPNKFVSKAYLNLYLDETVDGIYQSQQFKEDCSFTSVPIKFVGCWDTVSSAGILQPCHPPFATSTRIIETFRHALALDEHRVRFQENLWEVAAPEPKLGMMGRLKFMSRRSVQGAKAVRESGYTHRPETDVKEVWFTGCHSDLGGGAVLVDQSILDSTVEPLPPSLTRPTLRWMIREAANSGLIFKGEKLFKCGLHSLNDSNTPVPGDPFQESIAWNIPTGTATAISANDTTVANRSRKMGGVSTMAPADVPEDVQDVLSCIHDTLNSNPAGPSKQTWPQWIGSALVLYAMALGWPVLEFFMGWIVYAHANGTLESLRRHSALLSARTSSYFINSANLGGPRTIHVNKLLSLHYTVGLRMMLLPKYIPRAIFILPNKSMLNLKELNPRRVEPVYDESVKTGSASVPGA